MVMDMGSVRERKGNPKPFQARWYNADGQLESKSFRTRKGALRWISTKEREIEDGIYIDHRSGDRTFGFYADGWMEERSGLAPGTLERDRSYLRSRILPEFGHRRVRSISSTDISRWVSRLDLADSTKSKCVQIVGGVLDYARRDRAIATNPARDLPRRASVRPPRRGRALSDDELVALLAAAREVGQPLIIVTMARMGLRIGEALGLKRSDLSLGDVPRLSIQRSRDKSGAERPLKGRQEGDRRVVPIPSDVVDAFGEHLDSRVIPISGDLFVTRRSTPLIYRNWRRSFWDPTVRLSGVEDVKPHDLRRTCVTRLFVVDRWTPAEVQRFVGHSDARTTLQIYAKVNAEDLPVPSSLRGAK